MPEEKNIFLELEKDQILFSEGDEGKEMYIILSGAVQVFLLREGLQVILANMEAGRFFGEMSLLEQEPRSACIIALEPTKLLVINNENFQHFICQNPSLAVKLMKGLSGRLRAGNEQISQLEQRIHQLTAKGPLFRKSDKASRDDLREPKDRFNENLEKAHREEISCPLCFQTFTAYLMQVSVLPKSRNYWLREYYEGLEPLLFKQIGCPHCSFAAPYNRFMEIGQIGKQYLKEKEPLRKKELDLSTLKEFNYDYVLALYRLVLLSLEERDENLEVLADTALELSWLYGDARKEEEEIGVLKKAHAYFKKIKDKDGLQSPDLLQKSLYYQGLIHLRLNDNRMAKVLLEQTLEVEGVQNNLIFLFARDILENLMLDRPVKV